MRVRRSSAHILRHRESLVLSGGDGGGGGDDDWRYEGVWVGRGRSGG
jgi:hypothetical protein